MKSIIIILAILCVASLSHAQINYVDGPKSIGFGQIGVVAAGDNLQSGHFQNPALLGRSNYDFDVFANYQHFSTDNFYFVAGGMKTFHPQHTGGAALHLRQYNDGNTDNLTSILIPVNYAFNAFKSDWAGVSLGAGANMIFNNVNLNSLAIVENTVSFSGNIGVDAYRILEISDNQYIRFNGAFAMTSTHNRDNNTLFDTNGYLRGGTMVSYKYITYNQDYFNLNVAYQYNQELPRLTSSTLNRAHHFGLEGRYYFSENAMSIAVRAGTFWTPTQRQQAGYFRTVGATVAFGSFYIDAAYLERFDRLGSFNPYNIGVGYQVFLD